MKVFINNNQLVLTGFSTDFLRELDELVSYKVKGHYFTPQYRAGHWDGRIRLLKHNKKLGYVLPAGLFTVFYSLLIQHRLVPEFLDRRQKAQSSLNIEWAGPELRDYQIEAAEAAVADNDYQTGKIMLKMPVRSGKTMVAAWVISQLNTKSVFLVNSDLLFKQTVSLFQNVLKGVRIGAVGSGMCEFGDVTVATMQTLMKQSNNQIKELHDNTGCLFVDEVHHLKTAERWREVVNGFDAFYCIGLSATIDINPKKENTKGAIWLRASTGPIVYEITSATLIDSEYLVRPVIYFMNCDSEIIGKSVKWGPGKVYNRGIVENETRNRVIIHVAKKCAAAGLKTLVQTSRVQHMNILAEQFDCEVIYGKIRSQKRRDIISRFRSGQTMILVGTVFGEAVDIPECEVVINAEGGTDDISTLQRLRNLTPSPGKAGAMVIEFADLHNKYLAKHSASRLNTYKREHAFGIKVMKSWQDFDPVEAIKGDG